ncbi:MAG TPA: CvpA family protein [Steroidobacteraceae bacterium]|nr:CvpA family protein [Steroidobacteraceae bacterium]
MNTADYLLIAVVLISAVVGLLRGFLREAIAVITWVAALILAWHASSFLEPHLGGILGGPEVRPWAARAIMFILIMLAGSAIGAVVGHFVRLSIFSGVDRLLGFVFGLLRGFVVVGVIVIVCETVHLNGEQWWRRSTLMPYAEEAASILRSIIGEERHKHAISALRSGPPTQPTAA